MKKYGILILSKKFIVIENQYFWAFMFEWSTSLSQNKFAISQDPVDGFFWNLYGELSSYIITIWLISNVFELSFMNLFNFHFEYYTLNLAERLRWVMKSNFVNDLEQWWRQSYIPRVVSWSLKFFATRTTILDADYHIYNFISGTSVHICTTFRNPVPYLSNWRFFHHRVILICARWSICFHIVASTASSVLISKPRAVSSWLKIFSYSGPTHLRAMIMISYISRSTKWWGTISKPRAGS